MTEEFLTEGELARRQKKLEPDRVLTEVAPTDNYHKVVIDKACSDWSHAVWTQFTRRAGRDKQGLSIKLAQ